MEIDGRYYCPENIIIDRWRNNKVRTRKRSFDRLFYIR